MNLKRTILALGLIFSVILVAPAQQFKALVFSKTAGFRHQSIADAVVALKKMGKTDVFSVYTTEDAGEFTDEKLAKYDVVILTTTTGTIFNDEQKAAFQRFVQSGKGVVGIHSATDTEYEWPWYNKMIGAYFLSHPAQQTLRLEVVDQTHPSTWHLPKNWLWTDELYEFREINPDIKVLIKADESTYKVSKGNGDNHPMAWYHEFDGGRVFYTALGHVESAWEDPTFLKHLYGGIWYAATGEPYK
ncbi:ThuA domain-containing protein [Algoriphagus persicinus]|uniref:ThuA domain-containing protein n=1 Tax=Algoriphagus persicinus TaxID=3108754 RepID=UPI002B3BA182|nr:MULTISPECIES: ThuA domain-containing protein [unclassified Algoriphagus]MEB2780238.1 ThuA domain-containing protein [Algoriphagus sp. C2-6-M1]MEB2784671.1 ThuA domain-containing protein [Algoriphagus sp. E1-3-M2]